MKVLKEYLDFRATALQLREQRNNAIGSNIANAATPNYKARDVDFETALKAKSGDGDQSNEHKEPGPEPKPEAEPQPEPGLELEMEPESEVQTQPEEQMHPEEQAATE